jgi:hypothetical protein
MKNGWIQRLLLAGAMALALAVPASAGNWSVEGQFGYYDPDAVGENGEVYGFAVGYDVNPHFGMLLSAGFIDLEDDFLDIEESDLQFGLGLVDLSFVWYPNGKNFYLFAGPGYATIDVEVDIPGSNNDIKESDTLMTINGGLGYRWMVTDGFFIRPEVKARWFDGQDFSADRLDSYEGLDVQYSVGIGWRF